MGAAGEVKRSPVIAAERDVGGRRLPVHDAAELLALRIEECQKRTQCSAAKPYAYSITSSARARSVADISSPSALA